MVFIGKCNPKDLSGQLHFMWDKVIQTVFSLTLKDLKSKVEQPLKQKHPVAVPKLDAVSRNNKHTCGIVVKSQLLMVNMIFDFRKGRSSAKNPTSFYVIQNSVPDILYVPFHRQRGLLDAPILRYHLRTLSTTFR